MGKYGPDQAKLYDLDITKTTLGGNIVEREESENANDDRAVRDYKAKMAGWFQFVQTEDGSIPVTRFSREEDREVVHIKKAVVSAFQANFKGTSTKEEADPQSLHTAEYTYVSLRIIQRSSLYVCFTGPVWSEGEQYAIYSHLYSCYLILLSINTCFSTKFNELTRSIPVCAL